MGTSASKQKLSESKWSALSDKKFRATNTQVVSTSKSYSGAQTYFTLPPSTGYDPTTTVITGLQWRFNKSGNGINSIGSITYCDYVNVSSKPTQYQDSTTWGGYDNENGSHWTTAPQGYAISGLAWQQPGGTGVINIQVKYSFIYQPGTTTQKPDMVASVWNGGNWTTNASDPNTFYVGSITFADCKNNVNCLSPVAAPTNTTSQVFLNQFQMNYNTGSGGNWLDGFQNMVSTKVNDLSPFFTVMYQSSAQFSAYCCLPGVDANYDVYTAACSLLFSH